jgi:hypothetical protein
MWSSEISKSGFEEKKVRKRGSKLYIIENSFSGREKIICDRKFKVNLG